MSGQKRDQQGNNQIAGKLPSRFKDQPNSQEYFCYAADYVDCFNPRQVFWYQRIVKFWIDKMI